MLSPTCRLAQQLLSYKDYLPVTHDPYEFASGLRYWQVDDDGTRMLFSAWIEYFVDRPEDLMLAPFGVQEMIGNLQEADVSVQARALQVDCLASKPQTVSERKRSLDEYAQDSTNAESSIASSEAPYRKRARLFRASLGTPLPATSRGFAPTTYAQKFTNTSKLADNVLGNKGLGWSDARSHVWLHILCATSADLPATAFEGEIDELASHCTPTSADIRLCEFPMSIEEILTVHQVDCETAYLADRSQSPFRSTCTGAK